MTGRHAIVLAAGAGTRFGGGKLLAEWRGRPLILWAVAAALAARVDRVTVVIGSDADAVEAALAPVTDSRLKIVVAQGWRDGLSASLRAGVEALSQDAGAVAVFLGDMPLVSAAEADALLDAVQAGAPAARLSHPGGPAHPTAFGRPVFPHLKAITGDKGAKSVLADLGEAVVLIRSDNPGAVLDVDTPSDLNHAPAS